MSKISSQKRLINASKNISAAAFIQDCLAGKSIEELMKHPWLSNG
jgi:hypothetical protein